MIQLYRENFSYSFPVFTGYWVQFPVLVPGVSVLYLGVSTCYSPSPNLSLPHWPFRYQNFVFYVCFVNRTWIFLILNIVFNIIEYCIDFWFFHSVPFFIKQGCYLFIAWKKSTKLTFRREITSLMIRNSSPSLFLLSLVFFLFCFVFFDFDFLFLIQTPLRRSRAAVRSSWKAFRCIRRSGFSLALATHSLPGVVFPQPAKALSWTSAATW